MKRKIWIGIIAAIVVLSISAFFVWASTPAQPDQTALDALISDDLVEVFPLSDGLYFSPVMEKQDTALIFYPGGRVDYRAYAPLLRNIAEAGFPVYLVKMPLSLAVFDPNRADSYLQANPQIKNWVIGGHSLGGAMAANYVYTHQEALSGLLLIAAYPAENNDLSGVDLKVLSVSASLDGLATPEKIQNSIPLLPKDTIFFEIKGGNHAQFGYYGSQNGDLTAQITREEQQQLILEAVLQFLSGFN